MAGNASIEVVGVSHWYSGADGVRKAVLSSLDLCIPCEQFIAFVGPSGCGKTTLLNMLAGLVAPTQGSIRIGGSSPRIGNRSVGYMLARDALLPWRTVVRNVALPLEVAGIGRERAEHLAREALVGVGLADVARAFPAQLSHGMRQRAALARTFVSEPAILLMDEPFSALDAQTRLRVHERFLRLLESKKATVALVTHDLAEAITLADRIIVFSASPGSMLLDMNVTLERPRNPIALQGNDDYHDIFKKIWHVLASTVGRDE